MYNFKRKTSFVSSENPQKRLSNLVFMFVVKGIKYDK